MSDAVEDAPRKSCPDCAESVLAAANVCRYCGYRFDAATPERAPQSERSAGEKSAAGAAILSIVVPGLGHFYVGEGWRGGVFLASFAVLTLGGILTDTVGPGWLVGIAAAIDAYRGVKERANVGTTRAVGTGPWILLAASLALTTFAVINDASGGSSSSDGRLDGGERQDLYEDCLARGGLPEPECARIYLTP